MTTYVYDLAASIDNRWQEVNLLIQKASEEESKNLPLYDALCRATALLIVAHLEGFVREIAKSVIHDINSFSSFNKSPISLKRTYCKIFMESGTGDPKDIEQRTQKLIEVLNGLDTKFVVDPFLVESAYGTNKNPSPNVISKICANFGVKNIFSWINNSRLDIVFSGVASDITALIDDLKVHILNNTQTYPYILDIGVFSILEPSSTTNTVRSFWETFLDQLMKHRNDIAHGSLLTNSLSVRELIEFRDKVIVLEYALLLIICHKSQPIP